MFDIKKDREEAQREEEADVYKLNDVDFKKEVDAQYHRRFGHYPNLVKAAGKKDV